MYSCKSTHHGVAVGCDENLYHRGADCFYAGEGCDFYSVDDVDLQNVEGVSDFVRGLVLRYYLSCARTPREKEGHQKDLQDKLLAAVAYKELGDNVTVADRAVGRGPVHTHHPSWGAVYHSMAG